jgi:hypothetical protein
MNRRGRGSLVGGLVLVLVGLFLLVLQLAPAMVNFLRLELTWPFIIIGIGLLFFVGIAVWGRSTAGLAVPGSIVTGIGLLLLYQNWSGNWESWAYAWALIPGFVGLGILITGLFTHSRGATQTGFWMAFISALVFSIFGAFLGGSALVGNFWPVLVIALGVYILLRGFFKPR